MYFISLESSQLLHQWVVPWNIAHHVYVSVWLWWLVRIISQIHLFLLLYRCYPTRMTSLWNTVHHPLQVTHWFPFWLGWFGKFHKKDLLCRWGFDYVFNCFINRNKNIHTCWGCWPPVSVDEYEIAHEWRCFLIVLLRILVRPACDRPRNSNRDRVAHRSDNSVVTLPGTTARS